MSRLLRQQIVSTGNTTATCLATYIQLQLDRHTAQKLMTECGVRANQSSSKDTQACRPLSVTCLVELGQSAADPTGSRGRDRSGRGRVRGNLRRVCPGVWQRLAAFSTHACSPHILLSLLTTSQHVKSPKPSHKYTLTWPNARSSERADEVPLHRIT